MGTAAMLMDLLNKAVTVAMLSFVVSRKLTVRVDIGTWHALSWDNTNPHND
jgi:hypothetical protein